MSKYYCLLFFIVFSFSVNAQEEPIIKGKILNFNTQLPLESATVYYSTVKDSIVLEYTTTDKNGIFKFSTKKYDSPVFLKVSYMGYQTYTEEQKDVSVNKDFGVVYLIEMANVLKGVVVKSEAPPIRIKKDTLEFNAPSFKVRPDSNVENLLRQLPGFEVDNDGKITVNGKDVTQFLVNGKPFFDRDGIIALKNLPAEIISKVQVSDFKTKKEEYSKQESTSDYSSINLTIDEKKNKGFFGKFLGGYGSDDRYETSFVANIFNNNRKISILGSANNINSAGFSADEVFDNMGGGRNNRSSGGRSAASPKGITVSNLFGLNYSDKWSKNTQTTANYNFSNAVTENENKSKQVNFLPTGGFTSESNSKNRNENTGNKAGFEFEYKISPSMRLFVTPNFNANRSNSNSVSQSASRNEANELLNESQSNSISENNSTNFRNAINFNKSFEKKARNLSVVINNTNNNGNSNERSKSQTIFYQNSQANDIRNQNKTNKNSSEFYAAEFEFIEPLSDSLRIRIGTDFERRNNVSDLKTYNFDDLSQSYSSLNSSLTNYTSSSQNVIRPKAGITFDKYKFTFNLNSETSIIQFDNHSFYLDKSTDLNKKYVLPYVGAQIRYKMDRSKFLTAKYDYIVSLPAANQLLPITNLANPLNTIIGNPNLNPNLRHSVNFNFRNFDFRTRSGYSLFLQGDFNDSQVISTSIYDANRKRVTTYQNISGTYSTSVGGNWNQTIKKEANVIRYGLGFSTNYSLSKGFTNGVLFSANSLGISPRVYFNYDYAEFFTIAPTYSFSYDESKYENYLIKSTSNIVHRLNLQTTMYWPKNWVFGNDFGYTYNSNIASNFKKDFYLWNTSLSYSFYQKKFMAKVKVYDLLNQNLSATRTISATTIRDEENTILKRYVMFSLTYKIQDFSGMKKLPRADRMRDNGEGGNENRREN